MGEGARGADTVSLSVLICTYNRPSLLAQALSALIERTEERPDQVLVVNGGEEASDKIVAAFAKRFHSVVSIELIKTKNKNLAASRNVGLPRCWGDIIAMTDDDAEVSPDWVAQIKRIHVEHPRAGAVGGPVISAATDSLLGRIADRVTFRSYPSARTVRTLPGVNISYKRQVVEQLGNQDESLFRGEDVDYNWRAFKLGWTIYFDPCVRVLHHHRATLRSFLNQHYMYGRAYYLVRLKWPEMYCIYPHALKRPKDAVKALNFAAAAFYEPLWYAAQMDHVKDKVLAYPVMLANQFAWRTGMVLQRLRS
jgi:GT2 family glycosyltransferase